jgi:hypothetical protein
MRINHTQGEQRPSRRHRTRLPPSSLHRTTPCSPTIFAQQPSVLLYYSRVLYLEEHPAQHSTRSTKAIFAPVETAYPTHFPKYGSNNGSLFRRTIRIASAFDCCHRGSILRPSAPASAWGSSNISKQSRSSSASARAQRGTPHMSLSRQAGVPQRSRNI